MPTNKLFGTARAIDKNVDETRTVTFIASTDRKDRHGTVVNQKGWDLTDFNANPIIGYQHDVYGGGMCTKADPDDVIGTGRAYVENGQLLVDVTFETEDVNPKAEKIFKKVKAGSLRAVSVGFLPIGKGKYGEGNQAKGAPDETFFFEGQQLLELSIVNIPSNADALKKNLGDQTANALLWIHRNLGEEVSFADIEMMTIRQVIDKIQGRTIPDPSLSGGESYETNQPNETETEEKKVEEEELTDISFQHAHFKYANQLN